MRKGSYQTEEAKEKNRQAHLGKITSEETKMKLSESLKKVVHTEDWNNKVSESKKGKPSRIKGRCLTEDHKLKIGISNSGKTRSFEIRKKISDSLKGLEQSEITRQKRSEALKGRVACNKGIPHKEETKRKISLAESGENHYNWQGGISRSPYPFEWNNDLKNIIKSRDNYICQFCSNDDTKKLVVHHISYIKMDITPNNLITLCNKCHCKTVNVKNRRYWINIFSFIMAVNDKKRRLLTNNL